MAPRDIAIHLTVALDVFGMLLRVLAIVVVPVNRRPSSATAWMTLIVFLPWFGWIAFLLIGNPKLPRRRREKQRQVNAAILERTPGMDGVGDDRGPEWLPSVVRLNRTLGAMPLIGGNEARLEGDYGASVATMTDAIANARSYVHCEFYLLAHDDTTAPLFDALEAAVGRGVSVRVLFDHVATFRTRGYRRMLRRLRATGAEWRPMLPVRLLRMRYLRPDLRNHRKLLVVDGDVAFLGSQNLVDRGYHRRAKRGRTLQWQELMVRVRGPVVAGIDAVFAADWYGETDEGLEREIDPGAIAVIDDGLDCQVVPSGPGFPDENNLRCFNALIYSARRRVSITSPYFVPDESLLHAVTTAAQRGLDVELFVSEIGDQAFVFHAQRSYYDELLRAGVRIWCYPPPYILHAKHLTIDEDVGVIGSSNMDIRSFDLNMEVSLLVHGRSFVEDLRGVEDGYRAISRELTLEEHLTLPRRQRVLDNLARLTSALQ